MTFVHHQKSKIAGYLCVRANGLTLIELIVVIIIISFIMAIGIIGISSSSRDIAYKSAVNYFVTLVRNATSMASAQSSPTFIDIDIEQKAFWMNYRKNTGYWGMEEGAKGAYGQVALVEGAREVQGRIGMGLEFQRDTVFICRPFINMPADCGISIEFFLFLDRFAGNLRIFSIGDTVKMDINPGGVIEVIIGKNKIRTRDRLASGSWHHIQFYLFRNMVEIYINTQLVFRGQVALAIPRGSDIPLTIGDKRKGFVGIVDELNISAIIPSEKYKLPPEANIRIRAGREIEERFYTIYFNREGILDPLRHTTDIGIEFIFPNKNYTFVITAQGEIRQR